MTKEQVKLWCEALESGKYQQTLFTLRDKTCFCALGVLIDALYPDSWIMETAPPIQSKPGETVPPIEADGNTYFSTPFSAFACENTNLPLGVCIGGVMHDRVWELNDVANLTFPQIAQVLRWVYLDGDKPEFVD